jgi:hypothetical protein
MEVVWPIYLASFFGFSMGYLVRSLLINMETKSE